MTQPRIGLDALVGARLVVGLPGPDVDGPLLARLCGLHVRHLIVFARNFVSPEQFTRLLRRLEEGLGCRLLVMVDHEGGRLIRFCAGVTRFPDALTVGRTQEAAAVERQGQVEAEELTRLGVRVNLAPCVDVIAGGCDPVIGDRSYGSDPARVSALAVARIRGLQSRGVASCAKHFPGLGAVPRDPHRVLPTIPLDWPAMDATHLPPFRAAIEAGVALVMSSHVCYPALGDPDGLPATLSRRLIHGLLRGTMGFGGLVLTDDLQMGALRALGTIGEVSVRSVEAGHDLLLICSDVEAASAAFRALRQAYREKRLDPGELEGVADRLDRFRKNFLGEPLHD